MLVLNICNMYVKLVDYSGSTTATEGWRHFSPLTPTILLPRLYSSTTLDGGGGGGMESFLNLNQT